MNHEKGLTAPRTHKVRIVDSDNATALRELVEPDKPDNIQKSAPK